MQECYMVCSKIHFYKEFTMFKCNNVEIWLHKYNLMVLFDEVILQFREKRLFFYFSILNEANRKLPLLKEWHGNQIKAL